MAKNWTVSELTECIIKGGDESKVAIADAGKRFPQTTNLINSIVTAIGGNSIALASFRELMGAMPEWATVRKIDSVLKAGVPEAEEDEDVKETKEEKKPSNGNGCSAGGGCGRGLYPG